MKPNHLFTSMLALTTIVVMSCSAPRYAQQSTQEDDVYGSTAKAQIYTPQERPKTQAPQDDYDQSDEYYGTSDPYYDMDYSSRINRFSYSSPWRSYYDPYFDSYYGYGYNGFSLGLTFGSLWNSPYYGWGNYYSPFGYNPWGWNSYYGGGYYGGGYYGGGTYTGRTTNVPRPSRGREDGVRSYNGSYSTRTGTRGVRSDLDGTVMSRSDRRERYSPNTSRSSRPERSTPNRQSEGRATRPENYRPEPQSRPSYTPPPSRSSGESGGGRSSSGSGGGGRSSRAGRG
jgi:hypothetical protein